MPWPVSQDYNEAIQSPATAFGDSELQSGELKLNPLGLPLPRAGNFADVYEVTCPGTGSKWAVKCFTRQVPGLRERYTAVSKHLKDANLPFTVDFQFLERGIRIGGDWFPVLKMRWVEGLLLNEFVRDNLDKPALLQALGQIWLRMAKRLRDASIAHCDLQHGNVLLVPGSKQTALAVKLIDYDGMWVPALAQKKSGEVGHPNYQHPQRLRDGTYNPGVDRFPLLVIATALRALAIGGKALWQRYDNGDNLLFKETDLRAPRESLLVRELQGVHDPQVRTLVEELNRSVERKPEEAPAIDELLPESKSVKGRVPAGVPGTAADFPMDFGADGLPSRQRKRAAQGRRIPVWAWVGGGSTVAVLLLCAVLAILLGGNRGAKTDTGRVAQRNPGTTHWQPPVPTTPTTQPVVATKKAPPPADGPEPPEGLLPLGATGKPLNLDFETGTLKDWKVDGDAFDGQPIDGDTIAKRRNDMHSQHQGRFWVGGFEKLGDRLEGMLISVPFKVTHPYGSFLVGGGGSPATRVELVRKDTGSVFSRTSGLDREDLRRVVVDLRPHLGKEIFIRLVDHDSGGWGHLNFDDFRFHTTPPGGLRPEAEGFTPLFTGKDLTGWRSEGKGEWTVNADGVAVGTGPDGLLVTQRNDYQDFTLRAELSASFDAEAYLLTRASRLPTSGWEGLAVQISHEGDNVSAGFAGMYSVKNLAGNRKLQFRADEPFALQVRVCRDKLWAHLNGEQTAEASGWPNPAGAIGLFVLAGTLKVHKLEINPDPPRGIDPPTSSGVVAAGNSKPRAADPARRLWEHSGGSFEHVHGNVWVEFTPDNRGLWFREVEHTADYIELHRPEHGIDLSDIWVRLQGDSCLVKAASRGWGLLYRGVWKETGQAPPEEKPAPLKTWVPLSGGKDLALWEVAGNDMGKWTIEDGTIVGQMKAGPASMLLTRRDSYANFHLRCEAMVPTGEGPDLLLRCGPQGRGRGGYQSYAIHLRGSAEPFPFAPTGSLSLAAYLFPDDQLARSKAEAQRAGDWFGVEVLAEADRIRVVVDGKTVLDHTDRNETFAVGRLGFLCRENAEVRFRNIMVKDLPADSRDAHVAGPPIAFSPPAAHDTRAAVPTKDEYAAAVKELHEHFKNLYKTKAPNLGYELHEYGLNAGSQGPAVRYVALKEYRDLRAQEGDVNGALDGARLLASRYAVDALHLATEAVETTVPHIRAAGAEGALPHVLRVLGEARSEDRYDLAARLAKLVTTLANKTSSTPWHARGAQLVNEAAEDQAAFKAVAEALAKLETDSADADANLLVGQFRARQDRWGEAVRYLARGPDAALRSVAEKDMAEPADAAGRRALAAAWDAEAKREKSRPQATACSLRALSWYRQALLVAPLAEKAAIQNELQAVERRVPDHADPWRELEVLGIPEADRKNDFLHIDRGRQVPTRVCYRGGVDVTVVARTPSLNIRIGAGRGGILIFNWEGPDGGFRIHRPDNPFDDGQHYALGSTVLVMPEFRLSANEWHTLRWLLTPRGQKVWVDGKLISEKAETYDLSAARPVSVLTHDTPIDMKSLVVRGIGAGDAANK
jgi:hypothetical protein